MQKGLRLDMGVIVTLSTCRCQKTTTVAALYFQFLFATNFYSFLQSLASFSLYPTQLKDLKETVNDFAFG